MQFKKLVQNRIWLACAAAMLFFCPAHNAAAQDAGNWEFEATLYAWFASVDGTVKYPGSPGSGRDFSIDANDIISNLEFAFMGGLAAHRNRWSILADVIYMDAGDSGTTSLTPGGMPVNVAASLDLTTWVVSGGIGYDLVQTDRGVIAFVAGARYLTADLDAGLTLQGVPAGRSQSSDVVDGIVGLKGSFNLSEHWYIPYYADIGTGESELTWQAFAGIGYRFGWGNIRLGYRHLSYEQDDDKLLQDLDLSGPVLGMGFQF